MVFMIDPKKRASILRPKMLRDGKFLITRIEGSSQEADTKKILDCFFRYKEYIKGRNACEKEWLKAGLREVWSRKFLGLTKGSGLDNIKKIEFQNPAYSAAYRLGGKKSDPRDYNKVFAVQVSGCTYNCNYCYVPPAANAADSSLGKFFSAKEIVKFFLNAKSKSKAPMNVLRITGGEAPSIIPEIISDIYAELEKAPDSYLWIDTNLSCKERMEDIESDLKNILRKRNVGIVGCFKGADNSDFEKITGAESKYYDDQFETAKFLLRWKSDLYLYLPSLVYGNDVNSKLGAFADRLIKLNKNLPLRLEMLVIKEYPGAVMNMLDKERHGRPVPKTDQRTVFESWHNKILPKRYSKAMLDKFCCEVPLY